MKRGYKICLIIILLLLALLAASWPACHIGKQNHQLKETPHCPLSHINKQKVGLLYFKQLKQTLVSPLFKILLLAAVIIIFTKRSKLTELFCHPPLSFRKKFFFGHNAPWNHLRFALSDGKIARKHLNLTTWAKSNA